MARCGACGFDSPLGFRFCGACGAPLAAGDAGQVDEERKIVSAVFCDVVGFTQRAEHLDPEDVRRLLRAYYERVRAEFEQRGGAVAKFIGDAIFVLFGVPRALEDDAERAVHAALAALAAVARLNAEDPDLDLQVRLGVTTGEALVTVGARATEGNLLAWGDMLNTASRLQAAAPADGVLVDETTYAATREAFFFRAHDPIAAKGISQPVAVWQPLATLPERGLAERRRGAAQRPMVGREGELAALRGALDAAISARAPHLVSVVGDPGMGKSRLVVELFARVMADGAPVLWRYGRSPASRDGVSFWALGEVVKEQAGVLDTDSAAVAGEKLARAVREVLPGEGDAARVEGHLRSLIGLGDPARSRGETRGAAFAAWREFLVALARARPLVVVLEDVHWADAGMLDFVEHVLDWARDAPLLLLCTARCELLERCNSWSQRPTASTVVLEPLTAQETRRLVAALTGEAGATVPEAVTDAIVARADGNPLYSVEFVRMLAGRDTADPGDVRVPASLRGLIASRLDSLPLEDKRLLQAGAVGGRAVWPGAVAAVTGRPMAEVLEALHRLERREFLTRAARSAVEHEPEFCFHHGLIRDVAYQGIPRPRRGEMHRQTAGWLESLSPDRAADRAELLAEHLHCAYRLARESGGETAELALRARLALRDAGDRALGLPAFSAAKAFFERALELWPDDDPERPSLLLRLGKSCYFAETAGADVLAEASAGLLAAGDRGGAGEAETFLADLAHHEGRRAHVFEHYERALTLVEDAGETESKAEVLVALATSLSLAREHERTVATGSEAIALARALGLPELEARALAAIGISRALAGDFGGRDDLRRSIEMSEAAGSHQSARFLGMLADLEAQVGDLHACFRLQARARRRAEQFGHAGLIRWLQAESAAERYWRGDWDGALAAIEAFEAETAVRGPHFMEAYVPAIRGRIRLARGEDADALADAACAVRLGREAEDAQMLYPALGFAARAEAVAGSSGRASALADELLGRWQDDLDVYPMSSWAVDLTIALDVLGGGEELAQTAEQAPIATRWQQALVAYARGEHGAAAEHFAVIGSRPDEALARARAATALSGSGRGDEAAGQARLAAAFLAGVGARGEVREAAGPRAGILTAVRRR